MNTFSRCLSGISNRHLFSKGVLGAFLLSSCTGQITNSSPGQNGSGSSPGSTSPGSGSSGGMSSGSPGSGGGAVSTGSGGSGGGTTQPGPLVIDHTIMHRLTRTEYANTIRDLFPGVVVTTANLPGDTGANGFTKDSAAQTSPINVINAYEATASQVVDSVFTTAAAKANLVKCDLATGTACIKSTLQAFLPKAWRRPVQAAEVDRLMTLAATEAAAGSSAEEQLKLVLRAVLMSSKFLYLLEKDPDLTATAPHPVSDFEFASRLSYFIWSSMPDDELFSLAMQPGKLQDDATVATQITRMLKDPKGAAMSDAYASEWLQLARVTDKVPNQTTFPMVTPALRRSMVQQTTTFFNYVLTSGAPISDLAASDYTFVDAGLAKLYGLPVPSGTGMSKVSVAGTTRIGGLLGQSSLLMQYATADKPSAVKRGFWVMDSLLCVEIPPPPVDAMAINAKNEADAAFQARAATLTARELLAEHRMLASSCNGCHSMMDPFGLALENYDAVGQWRTVDSNALNKPIDASGQLDMNDPNTKFTDLHGLVPLLAKDTRVSKCVVQQLLTFALGRKPLTGEVADTAGRMAGNSDTLPKAILTVATSKPLRLRAVAQ